MMKRTTLTLDEDVQALVERLCRERNQSLKAVVNDLIRRGFANVTAGKKKNKEFRSKTFDGGEVLVDNLDNVAEVLAIAEGDAFK